MYNGIGLLTARGSGTSGYVQTNKFNLRYLPRHEETQHRHHEGPKADKGPNEQILDHKRKREIEVQLLQYCDELEEKGYAAEETELLLSVRRTELEKSQAAQSKSTKSERPVLVETRLDTFAKELAAKGYAKEDIEQECQILRLQLEDDLSKSHEQVKESHELAARKQDEMRRLADAMGLKDVVEGEAFNREAQERKKQEKRRLWEEERQQREEEKKRIEKERRKAEKEMKKKTEEARRKAEKDRKKAEEERLKAAEELKKASAERRKAAEEHRKAAEERSKAELVRRRNNRQDRNPERWRSSEEQIINGQRGDDRVLHHKESKKYAVRSHEQESKGIKHDYHRHAKESDYPRESDEAGLRDRKRHRFDHKDEDIRSRHFPREQDASHARRKKHAGGASEMSSDTESGSRSDGNSGTSTSSESISPPTKRAHREDSQRHGQAPDVKHRSVLSREEADSQSRHTYRKNSERRHASPVVHSDPKKGGNFERAISNRQYKSAVSAKKHSPPRARQSGRQGHSPRATSPRSRDSKLLKREILSSKDPPATSLYLEPEGRIRQREPSISTSASASMSSSGSGSGSSSSNTGTSQSTSDDTSSSS